MEPPVKVPRLTPAAVAEPPPLPPLLPPSAPRLLTGRCSPADADTPCGFATLPDSVLFLVFSELPADARAACARVCAPWREALLRGPDAWRAWTRLNLSDWSGVACTKTDAALAGAAALARGHLQELDLGDRGNYAHVLRGWRVRDGITHGAVLDAVRSNPELQVLVLDGVDGEVHLLPDQLWQLLTVAPALQLLDADIVRCDSSAFRLPLLRADPPYGPLRMRVLDLHCTADPPEESIGGVDGARAFGAALALSSVRKLTMFEVRWAEPAALEALTDAVLARPCRVDDLNLFGSWSLTREFLPALARLFAGRAGAALTSVAAIGCIALFEDATEAHLEPVCAALRRSALTEIELSAVGLSERCITALREAAADNPRLFVNMS